MSEIDDKSPNVLTLAGITDLYSHLWSQMHRRRYYPGDDSPKAKEVVETVCHEERYGSAQRVAAFTKWLDKQLAAIPAKLRSSAKIKIDSVGGYEGEHH